MERRGSSSVESDDSLRSADDRRVVVVHRRETRDKSRRERRSRSTSSSSSRSDARPSSAREPAAPAAHTPISKLVAFDVDAALGLGTSHPQQEWRRQQQQQQQQQRQQQPQHQQQQQQPPHPQEQQPPQRPQDGVSDVSQPPLRAHRAEVSLPPPPVAAAPPQPPPPVPQSAAAATVQALNAAAAPIESVLLSLLLDGDAAAKEAARPMSAVFEECLTTFNMTFGPAADAAATRALNAVLVGFKTELTRLVPREEQRAVVGHIVAALGELRNLAGASRPVGQAAGGEGPNGAAMPGPPVGVPQAVAVPEVVNFCRVANQAIADVERSVGTCDAPILSQGLLSWVCGVLSTGPADAAAAQPISVRCVRNFIARRHAPDSVLAAAIRELALLSPSAPTIDLRAAFGPRDPQFAALGATMTRVVWEEMALIALYKHALKLQQRAQRKLDAATFVATFTPFSQARATAQDPTLAFQAFNTLDAAASATLPHGDEPTTKECFVCKIRGHVRAQCPVAVADACIARRHPPRPRSAPAPPLPARPHAVPPHPLVVVKSSSQLAHLAPPPPPAQHRSDARLTRDQMRDMARTSGLCRFCGNVGHNPAKGLAKGARADHCPYFETHPEYNPESVFEYVCRVIRNEASPSTIRRRNATRDEVQHAEAAQRKRLRDLAAQSDLCRFCGNGGHRDVFAKGSRADHCPIFETHPEYNPDSVFEYVCRVLRNEASPSTIRRA